MSAGGPDPGRGLWVGLALGGPLIAVGVAGVLRDATQTHPSELTRWVVGSAVVHDLVLVPVVLVAGTLLARTCGGRAPVWLRWALATSGVLALVAWPLVRGYGRNPRVPSLLPRDYTAGLGAYLAAVWVAALIAGPLRRRWWARRRAR